MKRNFSILITLLLAAISTYGKMNLECLTRGVVAVPMAKGGNLVSWRMLATDDKDVAFDVLRDGKTIATNITTATCFADSLGTSQSRYSIVTHQSNSQQPITTQPVQAWDKPYMSIPLHGIDGYTPNDCSVGDVDGDGEYEIILKWDPWNAHDNAHDGETGNVYLDCYRLDGTFLWRIDLGCNIRAGAHYTQFLVYDFDGDGRAEMMCKTAPGSKDGKGRFVSLAATDEDILLTDNGASYVEDNGRILTGPEFLTVFSGLDGHAIHTVYYTPNRAFGVGGSADYDTKGWGDGNPGNRGERFLACVADNRAVFCRGYYTRAYLWAVDFDGKHLSTAWLHESIEPDKGAFGEGAHSLAVADVDDDGYDEIIYGSCAIDHDGKLLYRTGLGHGDALHLGDLDPSRPGLEVFMVHERKPYGASLRDARTGEILYRLTDKEDTGRGVCADIDSKHPGSEFWCAASRTLYDIHGNVIAQTDKWIPQNFRLYWDGDLQDELLGNGRKGLRPGQGGGSSYVGKWNSDTHEVETLFTFSDYGHSASCNGTKATPCLQCDLFGDWREEIIFYDSSDNAHLNIFSTPIPTTYRFPTLMHDPLYRLGIVWQNVAYNQPPHTLVVK